MKYSVLNIVRAVAVLSLLFVQQIAAEPAPSRFDDGLLTIRKNHASFRGKVIYDSKRDTVEGDCSPEYAPLSYYAGVFSYRTDIYGPCDAETGGVPSNSISVTALRTPNLTPVLITDIFDEASVVAAIKQDPWLNDCDQQTMGGTYEWCVESFRPELGNARNLKEIQDLGNGLFRIDAKSFALASFDGKNAAVRLFVVRDMGFGHSEAVQLGLLLEPKKEWASEFRKGGGFLMGKRRK